MVAKPKSITRADIKSLRGKYKRLPLMETLMGMKCEEMKLEEAKFMRCSEKKSTG